jgi:hypothetical protein
MTNDNIIFSRGELCNNFVNKVISKSKDKHSADEIVRRLEAIKKYM